MDRIGDSLARHRIVGLDTSVFIYHIEDSSAYADITGEVLRLIQRGTLSGVTSVVTLMELTVKPLQLNRTDIADQYDRLLASFPNFSIVEIDSRVARLASSLRAKYGLRPPDALQLAGCITAGATAFVTNDAAFRRLNEIEILILGAFLS